VGREGAVVIKTPAQIAKMREAGRILVGALSAMRKAVRAGIPTVVLDRVGEDNVRSHGAVPSFKGYRPPGAAQAYPTAVCVSVNDVVVHGVPSERVVLSEGDIVGLDIGVCVGGCHADGATTVEVGETSPEVAAMVAATREALAAAIAAAQFGGRVRDISAAIQSAVEDRRAAGRPRMACIRDLAGHGVGSSVHEAPSVPNFADDSGGRVRLREGMTLAIEPMTSLGAAFTQRCPCDNWGMRTVDGSWSAHFEHTVLITRDGPEVLTVAG
jgi:methionyl aminopeptidase